MGAGTLQMGVDTKYGQEFIGSYVGLMHDVWRSKDEEARLLADPTAYAIAKGLPVDPGARVKIDRSQPGDLYLPDEIIRDWTAVPGEHVLHVPAEDLISDADLAEGSTGFGVGTPVEACIVIACFVA
jgi:hypothetical protein